MSGGRPTSERKGALLAVRLAERHMRLLQQRAQREGVSVSEALRRFLDEHVPPPTVRGRPPTAKERQMLDRVFGAFGLVTRSRKPRRSR
jgi:anti-sigma factor RsiW